MYLSRPMPTSQLLAVQAEIDELRKRRNELCAATQRPGITNDDMDRLCAEQEAVSLKLGRLVEAYSTRLSSKANMQRQMAGAIKTFSEQR